MKQKMKRSSRKTQRADISRFTAEATRRGWTPPARWAELEKLAGDWKAAALKHREEIVELTQWQVLASDAMRRSLATRKDDVVGQISITVAFAGFIGVAPDEVVQVDFVESLNNGAKFSPDADEAGYVDPLGEQK